MALLEKFEENVIKAARKGLRDAASKTQERLKENAGLVDHTLRQLARLGYPYSRRNPQEIHDPNWLVHRQSGQLQDNIRITPESPDSVAIGVNSTIVPHFIAVVEGNSKMVPRDFPFHTLEQLKSDDTIFNTIEEAIKEGVEKS